MTKLIIVLPLILSSIRLSDTMLIRPNHVYERVIKGIHGYYNNTCIILLHTSPDPIRTAGIEGSTRLLALQAYFSRHHIRTAIMEIQTFVSKIGQSYYHIKRPLFVFLNDYTDVQSQFASDIAPWIDMSYPNWLIFFRNSTKLEDFFHNIYVPFDCTFMISTSEFDNEEKILEVYQVERDKELRNKVFGTWNSASGIKLTALSLFQRRNDLFGQTLRVVSVHDPPSSIVLKDDDRVVSVGGFFGGIMELLKESMNCTITYQVADEFGHLLDNGSWTGAINQLVDKTSDIVAAELMMTADRLDAVKFTTPLYSTKTRTFIKRPSSSALKWDAYISPFSFGIWGTMGVMIVLASFSISAIKSRTMTFCSKPEKIDEESSKMTDISFAVFGAFCSQGMEMSITDSIRIIHLVIHVTSVIILAAYSAALISALAVKTFVMPFTTMEGLLSDATYRFGVIGASADYSFFQNSSDKIISDLSDNFLAKEMDLPINYLDGLMRVCTEDKYAFMALDNTVAQLKSSVDCTVVPLDTISQTSIAMALRGDSPFRELINSNILLLRDSGLLQKLLNSDWALPGDAIVESWTSVTVINILPLIVVLIIGGFLSVIFLCGERILHLKLAHRKSKTIIKRLITNVKYPVNSTDEK